MKIEVCSICGSDLHILSDPPAIPAEIGVILGHEFAGTVIEVGKDVKTFKIGDKISCDPNISCGICPLCQLGQPNLCLNVKCLGVDLDGGFAQYVVLPEHMAVKLDDNMDWETAVFIEPLNCVMGAMDKIRLLPGETALVLGAGPIGLYFTELLKANGAGCVIVSEVSKFRAEYAKKCGADFVINPIEQNLSQAVLEITGGLGVDVSVDAVGTLINDTLNCTRRAGRILLFGNNQAARQEICEGVIQRNGLTILGNNIGHFTLNSTAKLLSKGIVDFKKLITHRISLNEFASGMKAMSSGEALEVVIYPFK